MHQEPEYCGEYLVIPDSVWIWDTIPFLRNQKTLQDDGKARE